jgi:predicted Zn finger-like uncharacterized protein
MLTCCPRCKATFRLLAEHLRAAHGRVQCGRCYIQFDALENLIDADAPPGLFTNRGVSTEEPAAPKLTPIKKPAVMPDTTAEEGPYIHSDGPEIETGLSTLADQPSSKTQGVEINDDDASFQEIDEPLRMPVEEELPYPLETAPARKKPSPLWKVFSLIFLMLLAGQWAWWQHDQMLEHWPQLRPYLIPACQWLRCTVEVRRDLGAIHIISRDVGEHPRYQHGLLVKLTFANQAAFVQPYPVLNLVLFNQAGQPVGQRRFQPHEYLPAGTVIETGMPPEQSIYAVLELAAPPDDATSFEFNFL